MGRLSLITLKFRLVSAARALKVFISGGSSSLRKALIFNHLKFVGEGAKKVFLLLLAVFHRVILVCVLVSVAPPTLATIALYSLEFCGVERAAELNRQDEAAWRAQRLGAGEAP